MKGFSVMKFFFIEACASPVSDIVKSPLAGDFVTAECKKLMEELGIEVVPPYLIANKVV